MGEQRDGLQHLMRPPREDNKANCEAYIARRRTFPPLSPNTSKYTTKDNQYRPNG